MNDLLAERNALTRMIDALPASSVIDRASLTARLAEVEFRIREAEAQARFEGRSAPEVSEGRVIGVQWTSDGTGPCPEGAGQTLGECHHPPYLMPAGPLEAVMAHKRRELRYRAALIDAANALRSIRPADRTQQIRAAIDAHVKIKLEGVTLPEPAGDWIITVLQMQEGVGNERTEESDLPEGARAD